MVSDSYLYFCARIDDDDEGVDDDDDDNDSDDDDDDDDDDESFEYLSNNLIQAWARD